MPDHVYRIIQVASSSEKSIEDAIQNAVGRASRTLRQVGRLQGRPPFYEHLLPYTLRQPGGGSVAWKVMGPMPQMAITAGSVPSRLTPS